MAKTILIMIDIIQWRSAIGSHNASCCHFKGVGDISFNSKAGSIEFAINTSLLIYLYITFTCAGTCAVYDVISMLLLLSGDIETNPGPVTDQKIELGIVFNFLKPHSALWDDIGRELKVDFNFRESLHKEGSINDNKRLEKVLHQWIESECSKVSWDHLIEILKEKLGMTKTAKKIRDSLSTDQSEGWDSPPPAKYQKCLPMSPSLPRPDPKHDTTKIEYEHPLSKPLPIPNMGNYTILVSGITNSDVVVNYFQSPIPSLSASSSSIIVEPVINTSQSKSSNSVSSHDSQNTTIPTCVRQSIHKIQDRYTVSKFPSYLKYPSPPISEFINLLVLNKEKMSKNHERTTIMKYKREGNASLIKKEFKESIALSEIAIGCEEKRCLVLIEGDPGVGKTTLAWELCKGWAEGRLLQEWTIVLLVQLRDNLIRQATTVQSLVDPYNEYTGLGEYIESVNGKGLLLIFDGFDELSDTQRQQSSLFMKILNAVTLSFASIIVTSRPSATELLPELFFHNLYQHIEVIGFEEQDIKRYIKCKFNKNPEIRKAFNEYSESHHFIFTLMYVPLHCALVTDLYETYWKEEEKFIPKTITQLYTIFIRCLLKRNKELKVKNILDLPPTQYKQFLALAELAAKGIKERQYIFDGFKGETFGLLQSVTEDYVVKTVSYSFLHLTLQEYLAAYYWSTRHPDDPEVQSLFEKGGALPVEDYFSGRNVNVSLNWPVLHFYCGLTGVLGTSLQKVVTQHNLTKLNKNFVTMLFESQDNDLVSLVFNNDATYHIHSNIEAYVVGYCIARSSDSVKWGIELQSEFTASLVNGIVHSTIPGKAGGVIQSLHVRSTGHAFGHIFQLIEEHVSEFVNDLKIEFKMLSPKSITNVKLKHGFNLTEFHYGNCSPTRLHPDIEWAKLMESLLNVLSYFDTLQCIYLTQVKLSYYITVTDVDNNGVNLLMKFGNKMPVFRCTLKCIQSLFRTQLQTTGNHISPPRSVFVSQVFNGLAIILSNHESFSQLLLPTGLLESPPAVDQPGVVPVIVSLFDDPLLQQHYLCYTCFFYRNDHNWSDMTFSFSDSTSGEKKVFINILVNHENACFWTEKIQSLKNIQSLCVIGSGSECIEDIVQSVTDSVPGVTVKRNLKLALWIQCSDLPKVSPSRVLFDRRGHDIFTILVHDHFPNIYNAILEKYSNQIISLTTDVDDMTDAIDYQLIQYKSLKELRVLDLSSKSAQLLSDGLANCHSSLEVVGLNFKIDEKPMNILLNGLKNHIKSMRILVIMNCGYKFQSKLGCTDDMIENKRLQSVIQTTCALTHIILNRVVNFHNHLLLGFLTAIKSSNSVKEVSIRDHISVLAAAEYVSTMKYFTKECPQVTLILFPIGDEKDDIKVKMIETAFRQVDLFFSDKLQVLPSDKEFADYQSQSLEIFSSDCGNFLYSLF